MGMTKEELGMKLKETREAKGLTQAEVAKKAKLPTNYYAVIERGEVDTGSENLIRIFDALGVKLMFH